MLGCDSLPLQNQGGRFEVRFGWDGAAPGADAGLYVLGQVKRDQGGTIQDVQSDGPKRYGPGTTLDFGDLDPAEGYFVVVEFRQGASTDVPVRHYGISRQFSLNPNERKVVEVRVGIRGAPGVAGEHSFRADVAEGGAINAQTVDLLIGGQAGRRVRLSNDLELRDPLEAGGCATQPRTAPTCDLVLGEAGSEPVAADNIPLWRVAAWPMASGVDAGTCDLCTRRIYARFYDEENYPSDTYVAEVSLDLQAPALRLFGWTEDAEYGLGSVVVLALESDESMDWSGTLSLQGDAGTIPMTTGATYLTYAEWRLVVDETTPEGVLRVDLSDAHFVDRAGNAALLPDPGALLVDRTAPSIQSLDPTSQLAVRPDADGGVQFDLRFHVENTGDVTPLTRVGLTGGTDCTQEDADAGTWLCNLQETALGADAGVYSLVTQVEARDRAGNSAFDVVSIQVDGTPPAVTFATLFYLPDPANVLPEVTHARLGTTVRVILVPDESVSRTGLAVDVLLDGRELPLALEPTTEDPLRFLSLRAEVDVPVPLDGTYPIRVRWQDVAGNQAEITSGLPTVDILATLPTLTFDQRRVVLLRAPTGGALLTLTDARDGGALLQDAGESDGGIGLTYPVGRAGAVEELRSVPGDGGLLTEFDVSLLQAGGRTLERLRVFEWPQNGDFQTTDGVPTGREVGSLKLGVDAGVIRLDPSVGRGVVLAAIDSAGNQSPPVPVERMELKLQQRAPLSGDTVHRLFSSSIPPAHPLVKPGDSTADIPRHAHRATADLDLAMEKAIPISVWGTAASDDQAREELVAPAVVQDTHRDRLVYVGTSTAVATGDATAFSGLVLEWNGNTWIQPTLGSVTLPPLPVAVFDPRWGVTWVMGVYEDGSLGVLGWDGTEWISQHAADELAQLAPSAAVYDPREGRVVVIGRNGANTGSWAFDGVTLTPISDIPGNHTSGLLVYDPLAGGVLLMDVCGTSPGAYLLSGQVWSSVGTGSNAPAQLCTLSASPRLEGSTLEALVLGTRASTREFYLLTRSAMGGGYAWALQPTTYAAGANAQVLQDTLRNHPVLVAGGGDVNALSLSVFELEAAGWVEHGRGPLSVLSTEATCVIPAGGSLDGPLLLVGDSAAVTITGGETISVWQWQGRGWRRLGKGNGTPPAASRGFACAAAGLMYNSSSAFSNTVGLVWGGTDRLGIPSDAVIYRLGISAGNVDWSASVATGPAARTGAAMAYDESNRYILMFGGVPLTNTTYKFTVSTTAGLTESWTQQAVSGPSPAGRTGHALIHSPELDGVLMVGASSGTMGADILLFRPNTWTIPPGLPPRLETLTEVSAAADPARSSVVWVARAARGGGASMTLSTVMQEMVIQGNAVAAPRNLEAGGSQSPVPNTPMPLLYDAATQELVALEKDRNRSTWKTWILREPLPRRAAFHAMFNLSESGTPTANLVELGVLLRAGASGGSDQGEVVVWHTQGATMHTPGAWELVLPLMGGASNVMVNLPRPRDGVILDDDGVPWVALQLRSPTQTTGMTADRATVSVDYLEVRARFCSRADGSVCTP